MRIPKKLPQFEEKTALLVVSGKQTAMWYVAKEGEIKKVKSLKILVPKYSDREGYFKRRGRGIKLGSGSVYEDKDKKILQNFLRPLSLHTKDMASKYSVDQIYLFAPDYETASIKEIFGPRLRKKLKHSFKGNFGVSKSLQLIKKIKSRKDAVRSSKKPGPPSNEAKDILKKSKKARRNMGKKDSGPRR